jgi:predicted PurR-regulated permease PerM
MQVPALTARRLLVVLALVALALTLALIRPFGSALLVGAVLAGLLRRPMEWLSVRLRERRSLAALLLTLATLLTLLVPLAALGTLLMREVLQGLDWVRGALAGQGIEGLVHALPGPLQRLASRAAQSLPSLQDRLAQQVGQAAAALGGVLRTTTRVIFQVAMVHIALYFFLADGRRLIAWLDEVVPLRPGQLKALLEEFRRTSVSTLLASAATAGVQAVAALAGFLIARAPVPIFLAFATLFAALIPAVGGALVVVIAGVLQVLAGHPLSGGFLIGWGLAVVGVLDNFVRPLFLKGGMELHAGIVFFALLGGIAAFGAIGLLLGPLIVTFLVAVMRLYRRELEQEQGAHA